MISIGIANQTYSTPKTLFSSKEVLICGATNAINKIKANTFKLKNNSLTLNTTLIPLYIKNQISNRIVTLLS